VGVVASAGRRCGGREQRNTTRAAARIEQLASAAGTMPAAMQEKKKKEGKSNNRQGKATPFFQVSLSYPKTHPPPRGVGRGGAGGREGSLYDPLGGTVAPGLVYRCQL
jgi:hypothetical protein